MTHDASVAFFARAPLDDAIVILRELLRTDESRAISIIADLSRRTAEKLIQPITHDYSWLADLPKAAETIASHVAASGLGEAQGCTRLERVTTGPECKHGFAQIHENGSIYWSDGVAYAVSGEIAKCYAHAGGPDGGLGFPLGDTVASVKSQHGARGTFQKFGKGIVCSSNRGTYAIPDPFNRRYQAAGGPNGWLGFPISIHEPYDGAKIQRFEGGIIYSSVHGTFSVRDVVAKCARGWLPISEEVDAGKSPVSGQRGIVQRFKGIPGGKISVYSSDATGIHIVGWGILKYYQMEGQVTSRLGLPVSGHTVVKEQGYIQMFEGGCVYARSTSGAVTVPTSTARRLEQDSEVAARLGWPISEEKVIEKSGKHIQFFEKGIVTREGISEIWLRP